MSSDKQKEVHIVYFSDTHGRYLSNPSKTEKRHDHGLDRLSSYLKQLRSTQEHVLVIENGDSVQGAPLVDLYDYNSPMCEDMPHPIGVTHKELGVDAFILGNHEFNFGLNHLDRIQQDSAIPWLTANIFHAQSGQNKYDPYKIFEFEGFKVCVLGLITEVVPQLESLNFVSELRFQNSVEAAERYIPECRGQADFLILVYHGGFSKNPETGDKWSIPPDPENRGLELWERFPQVDLLLTGHQHRLLCFAPEAKDKAALIQPGCFGKYWSHTIVRFPESKVENNKVYPSTSKLIKSSDHNPDPAFVQKLSGHLKTIQSVLETPLGEVGDEFEIEDPMQDVWLKKHPLIQWINNLMQEATGVDISGCALLDARIKGLSGKVRMEDIFRCYFFQDTFCVMQLDGKTLKKALEQTAGFFTLGEGTNGQKVIDIHPEWKMFKVKSYNYDMWDGIEYGFDISRPIGQRLAWLKYKGENVADTDKLMTVTTTFRAGGAFYRMFSPDFIVQEFTTKITDLMTDSLLHEKKLEVIPKQNFKIIY